MSERKALIFTWMSGPALALVMAVAFALLGGCCGAGPGSSALQDENRWLKAQLLEAWQEARDLRKPDLSLFDPGE